MEKQMKTKRQSNLELLRIISTICIIIFHGEGLMCFSAQKLDFNSFMLESFNYLGELGVNIFVIISGYFMLNKKISIKKIISIVLTVNFYFIIESYIGCNLHLLPPTHSAGEFIKQYMFPVTLGRFWFITTYLYLYIFSPFINQFLNSLSKEMFKKYLLVSLVFLSVIPSLFGLLYGSSLIINPYSNLIWFILLYSVGAYIRKFDISFLDTRKKSLIVLITSWTLLLLNIPIIFYLKNFFVSLGTERCSYGCNPNSLLLTISSIALFQIFVKTKINNNKVINTFATTTLGVYISTSIVLDRFIWQYLFNIIQYAYYPLGFLGVIFISIFLFLIASTIDLIRQLIFNVIRKISTSKSMKIFFILDFIKNSSLEFKNSRLLNYCMINFR